MKKNRFIFLAMAALVLLCALLLAGCKANPKSLAKQSYELTQQISQASSDPQKLEGLQKKLEGVEAKVAKLPASDAQIYFQEFIRLMSQ